MGNGAGEPLQIDWGSAQVDGGSLTVALGGDEPKGLAKRFAALLALIEPKAGAWGPIEIRKRTIEISDVQPGAEQDLRHLLESVVTQINSDLGQGIDGDGDGDARRGEPGRDAQEAADKEMGERFRAFASKPAEERKTDA